MCPDFKEFICICGMTHVKTSPYYPQSNGKMERWFKTLKGECIRVKTPLSLDDARRLVAEFVAHYNLSAQDPQYRDLRRPLPLAPLVRPERVHS